MRKTVWLINHYATEMFENEDGRHYNFARHLKEEGYCPIIICSSFKHKGDKNYIEDHNKYRILEKNGIPFVFIRTSSYYGNGKKRILNMLEFASRLIKYGKEISKQVGRPDVIIASSVHPLTCVAGILLKKKFQCKEISEIRDLWPETLVMFGAIKERGLFTKLLYQGEKWIYKKSDNIIFTFEGGRQYIIDKGWDRHIDLRKVFYINNGVDLDAFRIRMIQKDFPDSELDGEAFKVIYTGTIAKANDLGRMVEAGKSIQERFGKKILLLIYGRGEEKEILEKRCEQEHIDNVFFKGYVDKKRIPYILSKGDLLVVNYSKDLLNNKHNVLRYGGSHNKLFEYLAAGKPILYAQPGNYNIVQKYRCGIVLQGEATAESLANSICDFYDMSFEQRKEMGQASLEAAKMFDFKQLTKNLIEAIEG